MREPINPPPPEIVRSVQHILEEHGAYVPHGDVDVTVASMCHWLATSKRGQEYMFHILKLDNVPGRNENKYLEKDCFGRLTSEVNPDSIIFLRGCIVNGESYPITQIEIAERDRELCESCSTHTVCIKNTETSYGKANICSHCAKADEDIRVRESFDLDCESCTYADCSWHPANVDAPPFETGTF